MIDIKTIKRLNYKFMRNLLEETDGDSTRSVIFDAIYNKTCDDVRTNSNGTYPKNDPELRSRIKQDLLLNKFISDDENKKGNVFVTPHGFKEFLKKPKDEAIY